MVKDYTNYTRYKIIRDLTYTGVFNTAIAVFLSTIRANEPFWKYFVISQIIGLVIRSLCILTIKAFRPQRLLVFVGLFFSSIVVGGLLGGIVAQWITGVIMIGFLGRPTATLQTLVMSLLFSSAIGYFFFSQYTLAEIREEVEQERIRRLTSEKLAAESQLKMLQAQIEPHFLFNTLSNVLSLLDTDAERGKAMLADLTRFLRASLTQTRAPWTTLGNEAALAAAYLNIFKVRMGDRLTVGVDIPEDLMQAAFAPLLLQPLVENAVIHGLDPLIEGGEIHIAAYRQGEVLCVEVADTGQGFASHEAPGVGLANVRERLTALYPQKGRLFFSPNQPRGVVATIEVPYVEIL
jgi:sensor histidine kinase YesM